MTISRDLANIVPTIYQTGGNVGIGTTSPGVRLDVKGSSTNGQIRFSGSGSTINRLYGDDDGIVILSADTGNAAAGSYMAFQVDGTERARIPAAGGWQVVNCASVGNATPSTSGAGITFPATQSASSDANTLDDYEEGTWTPVYKFSTTGNANTVSVGQYVKIGSQVWFAGYMYINSNATCTGDASIAGLPFTSSNVSLMNQGVAVGIARRFTSDMPNLRLNLGNNSSEIILYKNATNGSTSTQLTNADFNVQAEYNILTFSGTYRV